MVFGGGRARWRQSESYATTRFHSFAFSLSFSFVLLQRNHAVVLLGGQPLNQQNQPTTTHIAQAALTAPQESPGRQNSQVSRENGEQIGGERKRKFMLRVTCFTRELCIEFEKKATKASKDLGGREVELVLNLPKAALKVLVWSLVHSY